jgi:hypothetical protein
MEINITSKNQVLALIEKERLIGVMNNTKWNALFKDLNEVDDLISYRVTYIDSTTWPDNEASFPFTSELAQIWGNFIAMEYLDIEAKISHSKGALLEPEIVDHTQKIIEICSRHSSKFSVTENGVRIWGYFRQGNEPELYKNT